MNRSSDIRCYLYILYVFICKSEVQWYEWCWVISAILRKLRVSVPFDCLKAHIKCCFLESSCNYYSGVLLVLRDRTSLGGMARLFECYCMRESVFCDLFCSGTRKKYDSEPASHTGCKRTIPQLEDGQQRDCGLSRVRPWGVTWVRLSTPSLIRSVSGSLVPRMLWMNRLRWRLTVSLRLAHVSWKSTCLGFSDIITNYLHIPGKHITTQLFTATKRVGGV